MHESFKGIRTLYFIEDEVTLMTDPKPHYDEEDVPAALKRETQDGPGFESEDDLPESDLPETEEETEK